MSQATTNCWDVKLGKKTIDTVYFNGTMSEDEVRQSLIDHDGMNPEITVVLRSRHPTPRRLRA